MTGGARGGSPPGRVDCADALRSPLPKSARAARRAAASTMQAASRASRALAPLRRAGARFSSGVSHEEEVKQMGLWKVVTYAGE